ncbi:hypothetical protein GCM10020331_006230 [Ectobacillus funiculus]
MIVAPLIRGRIPTIVERVNTVITPGETIDVVVTDRGIAVNPLRQDLLERFTNAKTACFFTIEELKEKGRKRLLVCLNQLNMKIKIVGIVEYRDGSIIDVIRQVK